MQSGATVVRDAPTDGAGDDILADGRFTSPGDRDVIVATFAGGAAVYVLEVFFVAPIPGANAFAIGPFDRNAAL